MNEMNEMPEKIEIEVQALLDAIEEASQEQIEQAIRIYSDRDELTEAQEDYALDLASRVVAEMRLVIDLVKRADGGMQKEDDDFLNAEEAAAFLGLKKSYLYHLTCSRKIPHFKYGGRLILFKRTDLETWKQSRMQSFTPSAR